MALNEALNPTGPGFKRGQDRVIGILRAASHRETESHGPDRRIAFRTTRHLIEGAQRSGLTDTAIAEALGVKRDTIRSRSGVDGIIDPAIFVELASITHSDIEQWREDRHLELIGPDRGGLVGYRASELLSAVVRDALLADPASRY
ncbi:hypothetical protein [Agreia bicolorata]|uniref:Homeodomain-like domain-containing protein n=1 Tax=Agreia bicolorata TaxID=110935 RepID=A0ABR5CD07_9MICO|nr:hypothetical protein [Agreia bicolorata]KJC63523.1 hypothetical protein TZ00_13210 [Agreia bicolorata]